MMIRTGYCRYCSVEKEDVRLIVFRDLSTQCSNCSKRLYLTPEQEGSPFYFLEEPEEIEEQH